MPNRPKPDLETPADLRRLVDAFYAQIALDELLAPVFNAHISAADWPRHRDTMTRFWTGALLGQAAGYRGNPGARHLALPIGPAHFARWLLLFGETVDELFGGAKADEIKARARRMGELFQARMGLPHDGVAVM